MGECFENLIERPKGLDGYRPAFWCAVCGRKANPNTDKQCIPGKCPNLCHVNCLAGEVEYKCGNTGKLRAERGIPDPVTFCSVASASQLPLSTPSPPSLPHVGSAEGEQDRNKHESKKEELEATVEKLQKELAAAKSRLTSYHSVTGELRDKKESVGGGAGHCGHSPGHLRQ